MSLKRVFRLVHDAARHAAADWCLKAPDGFVVTVAEPSRTLEQNALMWPILECFSRQLQWPVNGAMVYLEPEEWKDILTAAYKEETVRVAQGLNGGMVLLGFKTSGFGKKEFSEFIEFLYATAAERGISTFKEKERKAA